MPCNDVHDGVKEPVTTIAQAQDHHQSDNDACSPFCICSCCQGFAALTTAPETASLSVTISANFISYSEKFISSSCASIWQPPKLG